MKIYRSKNKARATDASKIEISVIIPCLNEERTIARCISDAKSGCEKVTDRYEIIVVDNNCTDATASIAMKNGAKVVVENVQGYGSAYKKGFSVAKGRYLVMGDGDGTYDFKDIPRFYVLIRRCDFVIGDRFRGKIERGGMPFLHRIGNPLLSFILRSLFSSRVKDAHCGFRMIKKSLIDDMNLSCDGMELASEMVIKASKLGALVRQVPISYRRREGESKLSSFRDGWYHLRFMLLFSPNALFMVPGFFLFFFGVIILAVLYINPVTMFGIRFSTYPMLLGSLMMISGMQIIMTGYYLKVFAVKYLGEKNRFIMSIEKSINLGNGIIISSLLFLIGIVWGVLLVLDWVSEGFSANPDIKQGILILTLLTLSMQIFFSSLYFISLRTIRENGLGKRGRN